MRVLTASFIAVLVFAPTAVLVAAAPSGGAQATREVVWTRHQLYAANELDHYRLFEQTSHMKVLNQGNILIGSGQKGDKHPHAMQLKGGVDHLIMVTCDEDCFDVNLRVYDADGKLVGEDTKMPKIDTRVIVAEVQLIPAATQTYRLEVEAYCREGSIGACSYAIGVNTK
jgi:hypothetical protein